MTLLVAAAARRLGSGTGRQSCVRSSRLLSIAAGLRESSKERLQFGLASELGQSGEGKAEARVGRE
jgi:hypothetical protein